ncbi:MAG: transcriptional repressor, partial [bacterium]
MSLILQIEPISIFNNMSAKTRNTKQRQIILDELMGNKCHPTADEIYAEVRKKLPRV